MKILGCMKQKTKDFSVITLTDLMTVFDILTSPSERIDCLTQRNDFQNKISMTNGGEMDFLGYYLQNRFDVNYKKHRNKSITFSPEVAQKLNIYKNSQLYSNDIKKPEMRITPFWRELILCLENKLGENSRKIT